MKSKAPTISAHSIRLACGLFLAAGAFLGCLIVDREAGVSGGCGNPPLPAKCETGETYAAGTPLPVSRCVGSQCGAGVPVQSEIRFGLEFKLRVYKPEMLGRPVRRPFSIKIFVYDAEALGPEVKPMDTLEQVVTGEWASWKAEAFAPAANRIVMERGENAALLLNLHIMLEGDLGFEGENPSLRHHFFPGLACSTPNPDENEDPFHVWPGYLGAWPSGEVIEFLADNAYSVEGLLEWAPDTTVLGDSIRTYLGVPGSGFWSEVESASGRVSLPLPGKAFPLSVYSEGTKGKTASAVKSITRTGDSWVLSVE